ncbi:MAG TPA: hypothetical protein VHG11_00270 [Pseudorhizobium sp.]|jgi:hypothetical protein|nr:hypothetical protein [Pseudorhizobium sp.]
MRIIPIAAAFGLVATVAPAADSTHPVREVMDVTIRNWGNAESEWSYIFDPDPLKRLFSRRFQAGYEAASKRPAYETEDGGPGDPFGYDVVTASQDGCPIEDLSIAAEPPQDGLTKVKVTFKLWRCIDQPELRESVNEVHFDVVAEEGRFVIDDIHRVTPDGEDSVVVEMNQLATETN